MGFNRKSTFAKYAGPQKKPVIDRSVLRDLAEVAVVENQACARKVELAASIWDSCIHQNVQIGDAIRDAGDYAASETAKVLGCSKTVADTFAEIGMDLRLRLPNVKAAFHAGDLDLARVRAIYRTTNPLSLAAAERIESEVLQAARRLSPGPLATEVCAIVQRSAPDEAAALRKDLVKLTNVHYRDKDMIATIDADLEAADAAACWQLINEMAATICPRDPRTRGQRLAAAYVAIMHQEDFVACTCEQDEDNPCTARRELPDRRRPLTNVTVDVETLAGLADLPGFLAGHGLIDAEYARELAAHGDWQLILTEAADLAQKLGLNPEKPDDKSRDESDENDGSENDGSENAAERTEGTKDIDHDVNPASAGARAGAGNHLTFHPLGRGRRRRGLSLPKSPVRTESGAGQSTSSAVGPEYLGSYTLIAQLEAAIAANPALAMPIHADGHGGFIEPPVGALTYRPSSEIADCVRQRDRTCRHPGCDVPAASCELDHVVPYLHFDPRSGGWTVMSNLHCLCRYHHMLKTMGVWTPVMLARGIVYWTSSSGTTAITLPGGIVGSTNLSDTNLVPHIPRKRRAKCGPAPSEGSGATDKPARDDKRADECAVAKSSNDVGVGVGAESSTGTGVSNGNNLGVGAEVAGKAGNSTSSAAGSSSNDDDDPAPF